MIEYIQGWVSQINGWTAYWSGIFCSYTSAQQIANAISGYTSKFWCWHVDCPPSPGCTVPSTAPDPTQCGYSGATVWQYAQSPEPSGITCAGYTSGECQIAYGGYSLNVDLDTASTTNPSQA